MFEKSEGKAKRVLGQIEGAAGEIFGDTGTQLSGNARALAGKTQEAYGEALDQVRDVTTSNPILVLAAAVAVGFAFGALFTRR